MLWTLHPVGATERIEPRSDFGAVGRSSGGATLAFVEPSPVVVAG